MTEPIRGQTQYVAMIDDAGFEATKAAVTLAELQEKTYKECGITDIEPLGRTVFVRTHLPPTMTLSGSLWIPASATDLYKGPMHKRMVTATVLGVGPKARLGVKPGDTVTFVRMFFAYYKKLKDGTYVGWIDETQISGYVDEGARVEAIDNTPPPRTR